jgi:hypothetical protein
VIVVDSRIAEVFNIKSKTKNTLHSYPLKVECFTRLVKARIGIGNKERILRLLRDLSYFELPSRKEKYTKILTEYNHKISVILKEYNLKADTVYNWYRLDKDKDVVHKEVKKKLKSKGLYTYLDKVQILTSIITERMQISNKRYILSLIGQVRYRHQKSYENKYPYTTSKEEQQIQSILKEFEIKPYTAEKWFRLAQAPEEIHDQIYSKEITQNQAYTLSRGKRHNREEIKLREEMLMETMQIIHSLD